MQVNIYFIVFIVFQISSSCKKDANPTSPAGIIEFSYIREHYDMYLSDSASKAIFQYNSTNNPGGKVRGYQASPSIGYMNGKLYTAWVAGVKDEELGNYIPVAVSSDNGQTWKQNMVVVAPMLDSTRHFDPSLWTDKFGTLRMSWNMSTGMWDGGIGGNWSVKIKEENNKMLISKPRKMFNGVMNVKPIFIEKDSNILYPVSGWNISELIYNGNYFKKTISEFNGAFLYKSSYDEVNKQLLTPIKMIKLPTTQPRVHDELMIVDLGNNNWKCMFRTEKGIYTSISKDAGVTWSEQIPFTELGSTAVSRFYFGRLKSGNLLLVMHASKEREKLTAYLSTDNGDSWPYKVLIDERKNTSYPDIVQNNAGEICIVYDYNRYPRGHILFSRFTEKDIISGNPSRIKLSIISYVK